MRYSSIDFAIVFMGRKSRRGDDELAQFTEETQQTVLTLAEIFANSANRR
jgi:hypothetical protein